VLSNVPARGFLISAIPHDVELPFEFGPVDSERLHVRSDDVLTEVAVHLDDDRSRQTGTRHDEVIALDPRLDAAEQATNIAELLPCNAFQEYSYAIA
jgi:hypothetical protein